MGKSEQLWRMFRVRHRVRLIFCPYLSLSASQCRLVGIPKFLPLATRNVFQP